MLIVVDGHEDVYSDGVSTFRHQLGKYLAKRGRARRSGASRKQDFRIWRQILGTVDLYEPHQQGPFVPNYCSSVKWGETRYL